MLTSAVSSSGWHASERAFLSLSDWRLLLFCLFDARVWALLCQWIDSFDSFLVDCVVFVGVWRQWRRSMVITAFYYLFLFFCDAGSNDDKRTSSSSAVRTHFFFLFSFSKMFIRHILAGCCASDLFICFIESLAISWLCTRFSSLPWSNPSLRDGSKLISISLSSYSASVSGITFYWCAGLSGPLAQDGNSCRQKKKRKVNQLSCVGPSWLQLRKCFTDSSSCSWVRGIYSRSGRFETLFLSAEAYGNFESSRSSSCQRHFQYY